MEELRHAILPAEIRRSLIKLGGDIGKARKRRRLTIVMMAERVGVTPATYRRLEQGHAGVAIGVCAQALFVLGAGAVFANLIDQGTDEQGLLLEAERLPQRVRRRRAEYPA